MPQETREQDKIFLLNAVVLTRFTITKQKIIKQTNTHDAGKLEEGETENDAPALTIYMKRDVNIETERFTLARKTAISVDELYTVALSNASKVVLATFLK